MKKKVIVKTREELIKLIDNTIEKEGSDCDLNFIDTFRIIDMSWLFSDYDFNGDISRWNVSNVTNMYGMFNYSAFNGDISGWNVSNVTNMKYMFYRSDFNRDISEWNVKKVKDYCYFGLRNESYLPPSFRNPLEQSKSYIGWKKLQNNLICKLLIPEDAIKLKGASNKCRANRAKVLALINRERCKVNNGYSFLKNNFIYRVGEEVIPDNFDPDRWNECSGGIHFFLDKKEAENYEY